MRICIFGQSLCYPNGGGHFWVYLNWALGFLSNGCKVWWLESLDPDTPPEQVADLVAIMKARLAPYGLDSSLLLTSTNERPLPKTWGYLGPETAAHADFLVNFRYAATEETLRVFKKTVLVDIDPGLTQHWVKMKQLALAPHNLYFTIGETLGLPNSPIPDLGFYWHKVCPCVSLEQWPVAPASPNAAFTTITHWYSEGYILNEDGSFYDNTKRIGFLPFVEVAKNAHAPIELAAYFTEADTEDMDLFQKNGWRIQKSPAISSTPEAYFSYIQNSLGEFSAVKPSCIYFQNAWISDRTVCFLASGKPCIIQNTGPSTFLPSAAGLWRFHTAEEATHAVNAVIEDYSEQSRLARTLAETYFDAKTNAAKILQVAG